MKTKILKYLPFFVINVLNFYLLPLFINDTGSGIFILLISIPLVTLVSSLIHGVKYGFDLFLPLITAVLFTPTIFIFYNESAFVYIIFYAVLAFIGNIISLPFKKK